VAQRISPRTPPAVWSPGEYLVIDWAQAGPGTGRPDGVLQGRVVASVVIRTAEYIRQAGHYGFAARAGGSPGNPMRGASAVRSRPASHGSAAANAPAAKVQS
jgi:hypothetical protein